MTTSPPSDTTPGRNPRRRHRPAVIDDQPSKPKPLARRQSRVSVRHENLLEQSGCGSSTTLPGRFSSHQAIQIKQRPWALHLVDLQLTHNLSNRTASLDDELHRLSLDPRRKLPSMLAHEPICDISLNSKNLGLLSPSSSRNSARPAALQRTQPRTMLRTRPEVTISAVAR